MSSSSWNNFAQLTVAKWVLVPIIVTFSSFLYSLRYIECRSYCDAVFLGFGAIQGLYSGIVHSFKSDGGLVSIAKMDQKIFDQYKYPLFIGYRSWGRLDVAMSLFKLYVIYYRSEFVADFVGFSIIFQVFSYLYTWTAAGKEGIVGQEKLVANAPGRKSHVIGFSGIALWAACRFKQ